MWLSQRSEALPTLDHVALAQDSTATETVQQSPREQQLREQLKGILQELEELKQGRESTAPPAEQRKTVTEKVSPEEAQVTGTMPEYELSDTSIVSTRFQKRPEGLSLSSTLPSETDSQPTRTMKESMESLPGVVLRQANGPRDFSIMIRGQGAKTTFAVGTLRSTRTDSSRRNPMDYPGSTCMTPGL